jgi:hypothetical protein
MTKKYSQITVLGLLAAALMVLPAGSRAEGAGTNAPGASDQTAPAKPAKHNPPFHGKLAAVDLNAKTLTVGTLKLQITAETKITKDGKPATLADGVAGEPVSGTYHKTDDGKLDAITLHFGARPETNKKETSNN